MSQSATAELLGVSADSVGFAHKLLNAGDPALVKAVDRGEVPVSVAAVVATLEPQAQQEIVRKGPGAVREAARGVRSRSPKKRRPPVHTESEWRLMNDEKMVLREGLLAWAGVHREDRGKIDVGVLARKLGISLTSKRVRVTDL